MAAGSFAYSSACEPQTTPGADRGVVTTEAPPGAKAMRGRRSCKELYTFNLKDEASKLGEGASGVVVRGYVLEMADFGLSEGLTWA